MGELRVRHRGIVPQQARRLRCAIYELRYAEGTSLFRECRVESVLEGSFATRPRPSQKAVIGGEPISLRLKPAKMFRIHRGASESGGLYLQMGSNLEGSACRWAPPAAGKATNDTKPVRA